MAIAYLCLGSNQGDRVGYVQQAARLLDDHPNIDLLCSSSLYETEPVGNKDQEWFVNAALQIRTSLPPEELLQQCLRIEKQLGRIRSENIPKWSPRNIDIDILFYDNLILSTPELDIPHPRVHERAFALVPLLELVPDMPHPVLGKTLLELHNDLPEPEEVYLYGTRIIDF